MKKGYWIALVVVAALGVLSLGGCVLIMFFTLEENRSAATTPAAAGMRFVPSSQPVQWKASIERPSLGWDYDGKRILGHIGYDICLWDATTGKLLK